MLETDRTKPDEATIDIIFEECREGQAFMDQWSNAIDAKVLTVFGGASALIGAIPAIGGVKARGWEWTPWVIAACAWAATSILCTLAYGVRTYRIGPDPSVLLADEWITLAPSDYRSQRIYFMGAAWKQNTETVNTKADRLRLAIPLVAIESGALLAALILQR